MKLAVVKVLCPQCNRLLELETFRFEGSALVVTCTQCKQDTRVEKATPVTAGRVSLVSTSGASNVVVLRTASHEAVERAAQAAQGEPFSIPAGVCPNCIGPKGQSESCPQCGILFQSFDEAMVLPPLWLRQEWVNLLRDWGNDEHHAAVRRLAQQADALAAVGRLYRLRQAMMPEDPMAEVGRAEVLRLATAMVSFTMPSSAGSDASLRRPWLWAVLVLGLLSSAAVLMHVISN